MKEDRFIKEVAQKLKDGLCDLFVGAGISAESGLPTWHSFLSPFLEDIDISIKEGDDLPLLAQYVVNHNIGNRNILAEAICDTFGKEYPTNDYHKILSNFHVNTVWTTNYDNLLEKAFSDRKPRTIISEDTLVNPYHPQELEIIKLHGDAKYAAKGIVLTKDDYNNYLYSKPMLAQRLREAIINRSLLFLGYSYQDYNIQNIMAQAAYMKEHKTNSHYILLCEIEKKRKESEESFEERKKRFNMWVSELNRIGIHELVVPKTEIKTVLSKLERAARDMTVYVTGRHNATKKEIDQASAIGEQLANYKNVILNYGQSTGIGNAVMSSFMNCVFGKNQEISQRMRLFPNPYAISTNYANDPAQLPNLKAVRIPMLSCTTIVISFEGGMGTEAEVELALAKERLVLPIIVNRTDYSNGVIIKILSDTSNMNRLEKNTSNYYNLLIKKRIPNKFQINCAIREVISGEKKSIH